MASRLLFVVAAILAPATASNAEGMQTLPSTPAACMLTMVGVLARRREISRGEQGQARRDQSAKRPAVQGHPSG